MTRFRFFGSVTRNLQTHCTSLQRRYFASTTTTLQQSHSRPETMSTLSGDNGPTAAVPPVANDASAAPAAQEEKPLPKLTASEFRQYNRMAEHMNYYHDNFRATWKVLYAASESQKRPKNMSIRQFIGMGLQFCRERAPFPFASKSNILTHHQIT